MSVLDSLNRNILIYSPMSKRYRVVLVGCGSITKAWLDACQKQFSGRVELVGFVDINADAARARAAEFAPQAWTGTSLETALATLKPDIVFNCTIPDAHLATTTAALKSGAHVLTEKPIASNLSDALSLRATAATTGRTLAVIQNYRCVRGARTVRQVLAAGVIGKLHTVNADFFLAPRFGGFRDAMQHVLLLDMGIHTFDASRFFSGATPLSVYCHEFNPSGSWYAHGASAQAIFEMSHGVVVNYRGSWCAQGLQTNWNSSWRFIGERGTLLWDGGETIKAERVVGEWNGKDFHQPVETVEVPLLPDEPVKTGHAGMIGEFLDSLDAGTTPSTIVTDNIQSFAMVEHAILSAESGQRISIKL